MNKRSLESVLEAILSQPTAPFHEYHVRAAIVAALKGLKGVKMTTDPFGNLLVRYKKGRAKARWVVGAHMDHPGWVRARNGGFVFLGGVPEAYRTENQDQIDWHGAFGVWRLPAYERYNGSVVARACDDLVGCAVLVAVIQDLCKREAVADFHALFTRAEEVGFVGMKHFLESGLYPEGAAFISLETSAVVPGVEKGAGPVVRVGDRISVFDHGISGSLEVVAAAHKIPVQRQLLDRGSCEASAVLAHGIPAGGLSILLENYHNCGPGTRIASEVVAVEDVLNAARLLTAMAVDAPDPEAPAKRMRARLEDLAARSAVHAQDAVDAWTEAGA